MDDLKRKYAEALLRYPDDPIKAGMLTFGNQKDAEQAYLHWAADPEISLAKSELIGEYGEEHFLPTKAELARKVWDIATTKHVEEDVKLKAFKLYGDIRGFVAKPGTVINNNANLTHNVLVLNNAGSDDEWERQLSMQQETLLISS